MGISDGPPPPARTRLADHPTLLFSWWCTAFAATLIIMRVCGRKIRTNRFFSEDLVMTASMIPLFIRMGLIQVVLLDGTNNVQTAGLTLGQIEARETGSKYVLAARIFYALFIWTSKFTIYEFLKRTFYRTWEKRHETILKWIRLFLVLTFFAVVVATLAECRPFDHYWQVVPDPGPKCRQGFAQLLTMGIADMLTDISLVTFPIPIILRSMVSRGRKSVLIMLFSASLLLIAVTAARVVQVIRYGGSQQYRTVWASIEILLSAFVCNGIPLGSFARGKGVKKNKYRKGSFTDSINHAPTRRGTIASGMTSNSDEDLFRSIGCRIPTELMEEVEEDQPVPAGPVEPVFDPEKGPDADDRASHWDRITMPSPKSRSREPTHHLAAFLRSASPRLAPVEGYDPAAAGPSSLQIADVGGLLGPSDNSVFPSPNVMAYDFAQPRPRPARNILTDLRTSLVIAPRRSGSEHRSPRDEGFDSEVTTPVNNGTNSQGGSIELKDVGGLLK